MHEVNKPRPPSMLRRRVAIILAVLGSAPAGGVFVILTARVLAFAAGVDFAGLRDGVLFFAIIGALAAAGAAAIVLSAHWDGES